MKKTPATRDWRQGLKVFDDYGEENRRCSFDRRNQTNETVILTFRGANKRSICTLVLQEMMHRNLYPKHKEKP